MPQITTDNDFVRAVASLKPGECIEVHVRALASTLPGFEHNGVWFSAADRVLENIIGSGYEYNYTENKHMGTVTYCRLKEPLRNGEQSYISPDRRNRR